MVALKKSLAKIVNISPKRAIQWDRVVTVTHKGITYTILLLLDDDGIDTDNIRVDVTENRNKPTYSVDFYDTPEAVQKVVLSIPFDRSGNLK